LPQTIKPIKCIPKSLLFIEVNRGRRLVGSNFKPQCPGTTRGARTTGILLKPPK